MHYYIEMGGGLGDIFNNIHGSHGYRSLIGMNSDDFATVALVTHNPYARELFSWHPKNSQIEVIVIPWVADARPALRRHHLPPPGSRSIPPLGVTPQYYPSPEDEKVLASLPERFVVFSVSAGLKERTIPAPIFEDLISCFCAQGWPVVMVGRNYDRFGREELQSDNKDVISIIDRLSVPGVATAIGRSSAVVTGHSAVCQLSWHLRKPTALIYPKYLEGIDFCGAQYKLGFERADCCKVSFDDYAPGYHGRFVERILCAEFRMERRLTPAGGFCDGFKNAAHFDKCYREKFALASSLAPQRILEIGVGRGHSAYAFSSAAPQSYRGYDARVRSEVKELLPAAFRNVSFEFVEVTTQTLSSIPGQYDLAHVDGDHSTRGCYHDMVLAFGSLAPGGTMIVDDYDFLSRSIRPAVERFLAAFKNSVADVRLFKTVRGDYLIRKQGPTSY